MDHYSSLSTIRQDEGANAPLSTRSVRQGRQQGAERLSLENIHPTALEQSASSWPCYRWVKRALDITVVLMAAPATAIVLVVAVVAIAVLMGRPIFFRQNRTGRNGRVFRMVKLRTMRSDSARASIATAKDDPRVTPIGKILRRSHIDELPQLWNILKGDMTLIGPRPEQPELVAKYRSVIPHYDLRHLVTPGLSGWAQVSFGYAADVHETRSKLEYDLYYVQNYGPMIDLRIVVRTVLVYANPAYVR